MAIQIVPKALRKAAKIILVGCPGAGKGTQSGRLLESYPALKAISSGDILRDNVRRGTDVGGFYIIPPFCTLWFLGHRFKPVECSTTCILCLGRHIFVEALHDQFTHPLYNHRIVTQIQQFASFLTRQDT